MNGQVNGTSQPNEAAVGTRSSLNGTRTSVTVAPAPQKDLNVSSSERRNSKGRSSITKRFSTIDTLSVEKPTDTVYKRPVLAYQPTYQLGPHRRFNLEKVSKIVEEVVSSLFSDHVYSPALSTALALQIAGKAVREVKLLQFDRYRIFACCAIGQKSGQSYNNAVSFLWDTQTDGSEATEFRNQLPRRIVPSSLTTGCDTKI